MARAGANVAAAIAIAAPANAQALPSRPRHGGSTPLRRASGTRTQPRGCGGGSQAARLDMVGAGANVAAAIAIVPSFSYRLTIRPPTRCSRVVVCGVERAPSPAATLPASAASQAAPSLAGTLVAAAAAAKLLAST
ncbi:hypothetical protein EMIHUDRAFT_253848 [Emiliania huxleyi CCMP1516]|uniref:Uncharacterized protein n=2 Tax=Emiliania huxleyi TaxID=2903 RepID=A0A0D3K1W5_EMIH1|nr:hypothetical protein EMIHUDRAFT_253848 [Emiliania huxleyi CCMP1516]EOD29750.1 hypothetical protein EMIHUDRAFT_253848 [Emiliania huxleyi CCMP1516]|eukprot:XP_005782179.1 hypothetical protein EMIHUDRAFT_253848 [Emiliania huxleyi CCMP1516]